MQNILEILIMKKNISSAKKMLHVGYQDFQIALISNSLDIIPKNMNNFQEYTK